MEVTNFVYFLTLIWYRSHGLKALFSTTKPYIRLNYISELSKEYWRWPNSLKHSTKKKTYSEKKTLICKWMFYYSVLLGS